MYAKSKTVYHPYLLIAFYLKCLPSEWIDRIPPSTRHDWRQKMQSDLCGYDWYKQQESMFTTLQQVAAHRRLPKVNRASLRVIALRNFMKSHGRRVKENIGGINEVLLGTRGLTPLEVLAGKVIDQSVRQELTQRARIARLEDNKKAKCCYTV